MPNWWDPSAAASLLSSSIHHITAVFVFAEPAQTELFGVAISRKSAPGASSQLWGHLEHKVLEGQGHTSNLRKSVQKSSSHSTTAAHTLGYPRKAQVAIFQLLQLASTLLIGLFYKKRFHLKLQNVFFFSYCIHYVQTQLFLILTCHHLTICTELQRWSS